MAALFSCSAAGPQQDSKALAARTVYQSSTCSPNIQEPCARWIQNRRELAALFAAKRRSPDGRGLPAALRDFSFADAGLLLVHMGRKSTSGYSLELLPQSVRRTGHTAVINLKWNAPAADAMVAQVITHPCILIRLPKNGFSGIRVLDSRGRIRVRAERPAESN
ncbi:MAG: protease complex subunit PrcB family protein [Desulfobacterales bacterium]|nr:protease complex subunit PrcB family protein [Desulfobacterales bacterium]